MYRECFFLTKHIKFISNHADYARDAYLSLLRKQTASLVTFSPPPPPRFQVEK